MEQPQINQTTTGGGSGANTVLIVIVIIILLVGGYYLFGRDRTPAPAANDTGGINVNVQLPSGDADVVPEQASGEAGVSGSSN